MERVPGCATHGQGGIYTKEGSRGQFSKIQVDYKEEDYVLRLIGQVWLWFCSGLLDWIEVVEIQGLGQPRYILLRWPTYSTRECTVIFSLH